ncbi:MAG: hypothetical protein JSU90_06615 [Nitrospiraceae bacterium]|nr:MAG: hypothetical protein JSU90_06615 [Nitrospiraceae bacterium]
MKIPVVKEWGSWAVFVSSWAAALAAAQRTAVPGTEGGSSVITVMTILGLALLINAKNPLASLLRARGRGKEPLWWSFFFSMTGLVLLMPFLIQGIKEFALFSLLVLSYGILLHRGKEHSLAAELNGFALLTLAAPVVFFTAVGELSLRLYAAVFLFFAAGVFKVRVRTRKTLQYRWAMAVYCVLAAGAYAVMDIPLILLIPLAENILSAAVMREERLRATGYTELVKGIAFIVLMGMFWKY